MEAKKQVLGQYKTQKQGTPRGALLRSNSSDPYALAGAGGAAGAGVSATT